VAFVAILVGTTCVDLACRTARWRGLLGPILRLSFRAVLGYLLVGYLANNVLPARLGELVRSHYIGDREAFSRATALGTIVVERIVDTAVLVAIASAAIVLLHVRGSVANAVLFGVAISGLLLVGLMVALAAGRLPFAGSLIKWAERWPAVLRIAVRLRGGLAVAGQPRIMVAAILWSGLAWSATIGGFFAAGQAIGIQLTWSQAAFLGAGVALSTAIPAGPAYVGTFELAGVEIAAIFGIPADGAFALTLLAHASSLLVTSVGGAFALARLGWRRRVPATGASGARNTTPGDREPEG
jgi:glycosyltransferase 2 family protein